MPIGELASWGDRARLTQAPERARALRLRDVVRAGQDGLLHRNSDMLGVPLTGALVAGPTQRAFLQGRGANAIEITLPGYEDVTKDYVGNEVALDYNAGLVGLGAFGVMQQRAAVGTGL